MTNVSKIPKKLAQEEKPLDRINKSGFPLQMALEHQVNTSRTGWRVATREHHWHNNRTNSEGWIDLVLEKKNAVFVVECKRAIEGKWAFLVERERNGTRSKCRVIQNKDISNASGQTRKTTEAYEISVAPYSYQSEYCVNIGENAGSGRELLENTAANSLSATEAIARSREHSVNARQPTRNYYTAIVTTAELHAAFVDAGTISLTDGTVPVADLERVPYLRFVKQLWSGENYPTLNFDRSTLSDDARAKEHTILVIAAEHFIEFLRVFEPNGEDWAD
jgi:hypothetical protein